MGIDGILGEFCAINSSQIEIVFNQEVTQGSAEELENYYIGLTRGHGLNSVKTLNAGKYVAELQEDDKTVIISGVDVAVAAATNVIWADDATVEGTTVGSEVSPMNTYDGGKVIKDRTVYVQLRNIRTADGKLASAMETSFYAADKTRPETAKEIEVAKIDTEKVIVSFDERINKTDVKIYLNSTLIADSKVKYVVHDTNKVDHSKLEIEIRTGSDASKLREGNNILEIVGVKDFSGNTTLPNNYKVNVKIADKQTSTAPKFEDLVQIHDGAFALYFDKKLDVLEGTIENLKNDNVDVKFAIGGTTPVLDATGGTKETVGKNKGLWKYIVEFDGDVANGTNDDIETAQSQAISLGYQVPSQTKV